MRLESLWGDIRFAFRIFKRSPAVALTVIGTLAVALGLNATAYSFFNAYSSRQSPWMIPARCIRRRGHGELVTGNYSSTARAPTTSKKL